MMGPAGRAESDPRPRVDIEARRPSVSMIVRLPIRWVFGLLLAAAGVALVAEWAARQWAPGLPSRDYATCRPAIPAPAIGAEAGASVVTRDYERHPTLGWVPGPRSPHHPQTQRIPRDGTAWVALFGDGSVADSPFLPSGSLPEKLARRSALPVVSYAVAGHSLARIVERTSTTLGALRASPRTIVVGFRADIVEHLTNPRLASTPGPWRSHLIDRVRVRLAPDTRDESPPPCEREIDHALLASLLNELQTAADKRGSELVVAVLPPAARGPDHVRYHELLMSALSELAIHAVAVWNPVEQRSARDRADRAAAALAKRLEVRADYYWATPIEFGKGGNLDRYSPTGFSRPGGRIRWMREPTAQLSVSPPPHAGGILVDIHFNRSIATKGDARELVFRIGEIAVARWPMSRLQRPLEDTFFIDHGLAATRPLDFRIELAPLLSAREVGISDSPRKIGAAIISLTLHPEARHEAKTVVQSTAGARSDAGSQ